MRTAVIYCRVSDPRQVNEGNSLVTQQKQAVEFVERNGYLLNHVFIERGESAKTDDRPVLKEMLQYCKVHSKVIQVVIIPKIDRLARNRDDYGALKIYLLRLGIRIESVGETIEDTPVGRFTEGILAQVAQFDNEIRAERCRGGMVEAVREGRWVWLAPKGYENVRADKKGNIAPKPGEADLIRETFRRIAARDQTTAQVLRWLAAEGVTLSLSRLHEMLRNKAYIGYIEKFGLIARAAPPFVPLVSEQTFYSAQDAVRRGEGSFQPLRVNSDFPLRGLLKCACGKVMSGCWSQGRTRRYAYYRCTTCPHVNLRTDAIEEAFRQDLNACRLSPALRSGLCHILGERWRSRETAAGQRSGDLQKEITSEKDLRKAVAIKCAAGIIPDDVAREQLAESEVKIARLMCELGSCAPVTISLDELLDVASKYLDGLGERWHGMTISGKRKLQQFLFPSGLTYLRSGGLRTADYPILNLLKCNNESPFPEWWTRADPNANLLMEFFTRLPVFGKNAEIGKESVKG